MNAPDSFRPDPDAGESNAALTRYRAVRNATLALTSTLSPEDCQAQSMPDASPVKWHLAHTTWFFETFLLGQFAPDYVSACPEYRMLFNSYYNAVGDRHPRPQRGLLTRPTLAEVVTYRQRVDEAMAAAIVRLSDSGDAQTEAFSKLLTLGINHEQQHQELILTDVKHLLWCNPLGPAFSSSGVDAAGSTLKRPAAVDSGEPAAMPFRRFEGGIVRIGHEGDGFGFDNESPAHRTLLQPFELAARLVTCAEYLAFVKAGGYAKPELWLSLGWDRVQAEGWTLPYYWRAVPAGTMGQDSDMMEEFTLQGWKLVDPASPMSHLSFFEADAYARWAGARLPTEAEWEHAAGRGPIPSDANLLEQGSLRPLPAREEPAALTQIWGDLWEWTASPYLGYPGFKAPAGAVGEYNGKFMCNQFVLRGGSFATSRSHIRASYRNFFPPEARWQFSGLRLARDLASDED